MLWFFIKKNAETLLSVLSHKAEPQQNYNKKVSK